ncbi:MAG: 30S ribosomal protein S6 [Firmicutes bacterium]|nr:30S ribosomal protein S6 [Bacillota bacterium]
MRKYEIMFIVKPTLSEDEKKNVVAKFVKVLTDNKATITNEKDLGQRELAYEIKDFKSGFYYLVNLEANDDAAISEFDRQAKNTSDIVRHLITRIED